MTAIAEIDLVPIATVARMLGVHRNTAERRALMGAFELVRIEGRLFARRASVEAYQAQRQHRGR